MSIIPIAELGLRMAEHGRIRMGEKTAKAMKSIETWRLTSGDRVAIEQVAAIYGGTVEKWDNPKASPTKQWQVTTNSNQLRMLLVPNGLSQWYEQWGGGGCIRRCDGVTCQIAQGDDMVQVPCLCRQQDRKVCKPYTRLSCILPEIRFGGVWRMETKGWNAAVELPMMEQVLNQLQSAGGLMEAELVLEMRQSQGGKRKYPVPAIHLVNSPIEMLMGTASVGAITEGGERAALNAAPADDDIDEIEEADLVIVESLQEKLQRIADEHPQSPAWELFGRAEHVAEMNPKVRATPLEVLQAVLHIRGMHPDTVNEGVLNELDPETIAFTRLVLADLTDGKARLHRNPDDSIVLKKVEQL